MTKDEAIQQIRTATTSMVPLLMKITPAAAKLEHPETTAAILKHVHQLTTELEVIKKLVGKLVREDGSSVL